MDLKALLAQTTIQQMILLGLFLVSFLIQLYYYLGIYLRVGIYKEKGLRGKEKAVRDEELAGVSVVICARNEAGNLRRFLPVILEQAYPEFEVVVVNDRSTDETEEILQELSHSHPQLRFTSLPENGNSGPGKKLALALGLKSARYDRILLTDADCKPSSPHWISHMTSGLHGDTQIVLGYGGYERKRGLINLVIRYETLFTAIQYLGLALKGKAYMGVGRNLAYTRELFFTGKGFSSHYHISSGDDDLFVNQHANRTNTLVVINPLAHTSSLPKLRFRDWFRQKRRHLGAGSHYSTISRIRLGVEIISRLLLYGLYIYLAISTPWLWWLSGVFLFFQMIRLLVLKLGMRRLNEKYLLLPSLILDPILPLILGIIWFRGLFTTKQQPWR